MKNDLDFVIALSSVPSSFSIKTSNSFCGWSSWLSSELQAKEVTQDSNGKKKSKEYCENAEKNIDEIIDLTNTICDRIGVRIEIIKN